jgi:hypothetical protein
VVDASPESECGDNGVVAEEDSLSLPKAAKLAEIQRLQRKDSSLKAMCNYLEQGLLPADEKEAK